MEQPFWENTYTDDKVSTVYKEWEITKTMEYVFDDEHPGVEKHKHASNKIVATKP